MEADRARLRVISLDELVHSNREPTYAELCQFLGVADEPAMRDFFETEMNADAAHHERWRKGLTESEQEEIIELYETTLKRLGDEGYYCAPVLLRSYERQLAAYGS